MAKATDIWMPIAIGDFVAATMHLNTAEIGGYFLIIMHQWQAGHIPPADLQNITRMDAKQWKKSESRIKKFLSVDEVGEFFQKRTEAEKIKAEAVSEKNRKNGAPKSPPNEPPNDGETDAKREPKPTQSQSQELTTPPTPLPGGLRKSEQRKLAAATVGMQADSEPMTEEDALEIRRQLEAKGRKF